MIESFEDIKKDFLFTEKDVERIKKLKPIMEKYADEFIEQFYHYISNFKETKKYLDTPEKIRRHKKELKKWYLKLFSGKYDYEYFMKLYKISETHVKIGLPTHYINSSFNFIRNFIIEKINKELGLTTERNEIVKSIGKLLDINLDVLTFAYREEELTKFAAMSKAEKTILMFSRKFTDILEFGLVLALIIVSFFGFSLFAKDFYHLLFLHVDYTHGILTILGDLLILWAIVELMNEEISHLKGGKFAITAFIALAIAAVLRKILIISLSPEKKMDLAIYGGIVLVLSLSYWLLYKQHGKK
jgi:uncharacterized membrane protein (DUF373 family)